MNLHSHPMGKAGHQTGGSIPGVANLPSYSLNLPCPSRIPVLIAVPHAGRTYPGALVEAMHNPGFAALRLEDRLVDILAQQVAAATGAALLVAHAPRAMIDLNRGPEDIDWSMLAGDLPAQALDQPPSRRARNGLGLIPRRLPGLGELWKVRQSGKDLEDRIVGIHAPYHDALDAILQSLRQRWGAALLIDLHSMPPLTQDGLRSARFVIGDRFGRSSSGRLISAAFNYLAKVPVRHAHNRPYAGGYVLERHAAPQAGLHGIQLEVDRSCYLDRQLAQLGDGFDQVAETIAGMVQCLAAETAALGQDRFQQTWPDAAE